MRLESSAVGLVPKCWQPQHKDAPVRCNIHSLPSTQLSPSVTSKGDWGGRCVQGVKGVPCIWRVLPELAQRYDLPIDLPFELVRHSTVPRVCCMLSRSQPCVFAEPYILV